MLYGLWFYVFMVLYFMVLSFYGFMVSWFLGFKSRTTTNECQFIVWVSCSHFCIIVTITSGVPEIGADTFAAAFSSNGTSSSFMEFHGMP